MVLSDNGSPPAPQVEYRGSNPRRTTFYPCSSTVEQEAYIFKVEGSSPSEGTVFSGSSTVEQSSDKG